MLRHPSQAFFLGTFSMGFATIVNMVAFVGIPAFGHNFVILSWVLWWLDATISLLVNMGVVSTMPCRGHPSSNVDYSSSSTSPTKSNALRH